MSGHTLPSVLTLKARLAIAAALLGAGTLLTTAILYAGLNEVARRLDMALASEVRIARYSSLSAQASAFLVVATEAVQTRQSAETLAQRIAPVAAQMQRTFALLHQDVEQAVRAVAPLGIDEQSRHGAQSLGVARMQAVLESTVRGLTVPGQDPDGLRPYLDGFATGFDQVLSQAVNTEVLFRNDILAGIETLRQRLTYAALAIAAATLVAIALFYFGLIRPQFRRLDALRAAAHQIGQGDFSIGLPITRGDEIGQLSAETNRMASALLARQEMVEAEWTRLNETVGQRTEELRNANATLAEIDDRRRRFFADISHELRTPLTVILMEAQIGRRGSPDPASVFTTIENRAIRLNRRIDDLLRLARSETGELALDIKAANLCELVKQAHIECRAEIDNAGMELTLPPMPDLNVMCDANWTRQVIASLIRNAIRHARSGTKLHIAPLVETDMAGISLIDNGPGISAEQQKTVLERFAQASTATARDGFGIGLALAHWVIEAQHGRIALTSPLDGDEAIGAAPGTKISVRLPREPM